MSNKECGCTKPPNPCCVAQHRQYVITDGDIGQHKSVLQHNCKCGTCCRRLALFADRPNIVETDTWLIKAIARVTFGCEKWCYGSFVEVDWKRGVILDLLGDFVNVDFEVIEANGTLPTVPLGFGAVSACCGAGAARGCATRTTARMVITSETGSGLIPIPPFAYAVQFATVTPAVLYSSATTFIQLGSGNAGPFTSAVSIVTGDVIPDPWTIINGAESLQINTTGTAEFEAVFLIGV